MRKLSGLLILLGTLCILASGVLLWHNHREAEAAGSFASIAIPQVERAISAHVAAATAPVGTGETTAPIPVMPEVYGDPHRSMTVIGIDGHDYIGVLSIPAIDYTAPVQAEYTEANLRLSAVRYYGSTYEGNLVLCAHNYDGLYSEIQTLRLGDVVTFRDMDGVVWTYEIAALENLKPTDVAGMTGSDYPFTFFTCNYSSSLRLTVRCTLQSTAPAQASESASGS